MGILSFFSRRVFSPLSLPLALALALSSAAPAQAQPADSHHEEPGSTVVSHQKFIIDPRTKAQVEIIVIEGETYEDLLNAYSQATRESHPKLKDPFANLSVTGLITDPEAADAIEKALPSSVPRTERNYLLWKRGGANRGPSSVRARSHSQEKPSVSSTPPKSRIDLLRLYEQTFPKLESRLVELNEAGSELIGTRFKASPHRKILIGIRTFLVGAGSAAGMVLSNADPRVVMSMFVNGAVTGYSVQMALDWLRAQYTYAQGWEKRIVNAFLHPFGYEWKPKAGTHSSYGASQTKWYMTEVAVNEAHKVHGYVTYSVLSDAQTMVNGKPMIPTDFQLLPGLSSAVEVGVHTVATQGVYEKVFNDEFARRTTPIHVLAAYYSELAQKAADPGVQKDYLAVVEACIRQGIRERVFAGALANVGSFSWIMALSLQDPIHSKIASYSLLPVAASLKGYFAYRQRLENIAMGREVDKLKLKAIPRMILSKCKSTITEVKDWAREFAGEIVKIEPKAVAR